MGYYNTFVVRIWCNGIRKLNRGYVQHVSSKEQRHFLDINDLTDFILNHLGPPADDPEVDSRTVGNDAPGENLGGILDYGEEV